MTETVHLMTILFIFRENYRYMLQERSSCVMISIEREQLA